MLTEIETETETEKESTEDTMTQETIAEDMKMIMIMTVLGTGNKIADVMRETIFPTTTKALLVETTLQCG